MACDTMYTVLQVMSHTGSPEHRNDFTSVEGQLFLPWMDYELVNAAMFSVIAKPFGTLGLILIVSQSSVDLHQLLVAGSMVV